MYQSLAGNVLDISLEEADQQKILTEETIKNIW